MVVLAFCRKYAIPSGLCLVEPSFVFQQDNDLKHTSGFCEGYLTTKESDGMRKMNEMKATNKYWAPLEVNCQSRLLIENHSKRQAVELTERIARHTAALKTLRCEPYSGVLDIFCYTYFYKFCLRVLTSPALIHNVVNNKKLI